MTFKSQVGLKGEFQLALNTKNGLVPLCDGAVSPNLIVDHWLNHYRTIAAGTEVRFASNTQANHLFARVAVGAGSTPPTVADTALESTIATQNSSGSSLYDSTVTYDSVTGLFKIVNTVTHFFPLGGVIGNLSEVGIFCTTSTSTYRLFSRALIRDVNGDPTTITMTADDQLVVIYTLESYIPYTYTGSFNLIDPVTEQSVPYTFEAKLTIPFSSVKTFLNVFNATPCAGFAVNTLQVRETDFTFPTPFQRLGTNWGTSVGSSSLQIRPNLTSGPGRKARVRFPINAANFVGGIKGIGFAHYLNNGSNVDTQPFVMKFNPPIPKDNTFLLDFEFETDFVRL